MFPKKPYRTISLFQKSISAVTVILSLCTFSYGQKPAIDSFLASIENIEERAYKADSIAYDLRHNELDETSYYLGVAIDLSNKIKDQSKAAGVLRAVAGTYYSIDDFEKSISLNQSSLNLSKKYKDFAGVSRCFYQLTLCHQEQSNYDSAIKSADSSIYYANISGDLTSIANAYNKMGILHYKLKDYNLAISYFNKLKPIELELGLDYRLFSYYLNFGLIYKSTQHLDSARFYMEKAEKFLENPELEYKKVIAYVNLAALTNEEGRLRESITYCKKALAAIGDKKRTGTFKNIYHNLGGVYTDLNILDSAIYFYNKSLEFTRENDIRFRESVSAKMSVVYAQKGDYEQAYNLIDEAYELNQELYTEESQSSLADTKVKYDVLEKEKSLLENQLKLTKSEQKQQRTLLLSLLSLLVLSLIGFWIYYKQKQRRNKIAIALTENELKIEKLKELDEIKSNFFANISHELRTPLTLILGPLNDLLKGEFSQDTKGHFLLMDRNARRLNRLINQLLELAKIESGKMELNLRRGNVLAFVKSVVTSFDSLLESKNMKLFFHSNDLEVTGDIDPDKVQTVLFNLMSNAIKFSKPGDAIQVFINKLGEDVEIKVSDEGKGMNKEVAQHAFDHFYSSSPKGVDTGTGIGLALAKQLVELHRGSVSVVSESNKGSTFTVRLPLNLSKELGLEIQDGIFTIDTEIPQDYGQLANISESALHTAEKENTILIVDDNADIRSFIKSQLHEGYDIAQAENGLVALEVAKDVMPDLIVLDVMMPEMDGFTFCEHLRSDPQISHIPIIMLTAKSTDADKVHGIETGADAYMLKPFQSEELQTRIRKLIEGRDNLRRKFATSGGIQVSEVTVTSLDERFLNSCVKIVEENIRNEDFSIDDFARDMSMSRSQFYKKLKALTDKSPSSFIRSIKLHRAKDLLEQKSGTVSDVAYDLGFNSLSYFSRTFKDEFGVSPTDISV